MASPTASTSGQPPVNPEIRNFMITPEKGLARARLLRFGATLYRTAAVVSAVALVILAVGTFAVVGACAPICLPVVATLTFMCRKLPSKIYNIFEFRSKLVVLHALSFKWVPQLVSLVPSDNDAIKRKLETLNVPNKSIPENPSQCPGIRTAIALHVFCNNVENTFKKACPPHSISGEVLSFAAPTSLDEPNGKETAEENAFRKELKETISQFESLELKTQLRFTSKACAAMWHALIQRPNFQGIFEPQDLITYYKGEKNSDIYDHLELQDTALMAERFIMAIDLETSTG